MNDDYAEQQQAKKSGKLRYVLGGLLIAFVGGGLLAVWGAQRYNLLGTQNTAQAPRVIAADDNYPKPGLETLDAAPAQPIPIAPGADPAGADPAGADLVASRVDDLESRLSRINAQAEAASGNVGRAEGMMVAFAARRAIDSGAALGYIENQMIARFGASQGPAVNTIIKSAQDPVTIEILRAELNRQGDAWTSPAGISAWGKVQREMSELFVLRRDTTPSPAPAQRLKRAREFTEAGNVEAAMREVAAMPGKAQARSWLDKAARYVNVRKALDNIERSALAVPAVTAPLPTPQPTVPPTTNDPAIAPMSDDVPDENQ
jgi:hypothetical protein